jgi:hypothetical protein
MDELASKRPPMINRQNIGFFESELAKFKEKWCNNKKYACAECPKILHQANGECTCVAAIVEIKIIEFKTLVN